MRKPYRSRYLWSLLLLFTLPCSWVFLLALFAASGMTHLTPI